MGADIVPSWFWARPSMYGLWRDRRAVTREIRADCDVAIPGLREACATGDQSSLYGWDRWSPELDDTTRPFPTFSEICLTAVQAVRRAIAAERRPVEVRSR